MDKKVLTKAQLKALLQIGEDGGLDLSGIRSATIGALVGLGLVTVRFAEHEKVYRPSRSWSSTRWTRTCVELVGVSLTDLGRTVLREVGK